MNREHDFIRSLEDYLEEFDGATPLPDKTRDAIRAKLPTMRQLPAWWPGWRLPEMNNIVKLSVAAAVMVIAALLGFNYLVAPNVGDSGLDDPSPTPTPAPVSFTQLEGEGTELEPGTYLIDYAAPVPVAITVPDQPFENWPSPWYKAMFDSGPWHQSNEASIGFAAVANVSIDPCAPELGMLDPAVGPTVTELADAIAVVPGVEVTRDDATLDGYAGVLLEVAVSDGSDACAEEPVLLQTTQGDPLFLPAPDDRLRVWILDVDGTRLVVWASEAAGFSSPEHVQSLIDTIQIGAP